MSDVTIFQDITTDSALLELEAESKKYDGLYVDMEQAEQRKYVKDKATLINGMIKKLDRSRIDKTKEYKNSVETEAKEIKQRLEFANRPFTLLMDKHKEKRAAILSAEKAALQLVEDAKKKEEDHDSAIMEDKVRTFEAAETLRLQKERDEQIAKGAADNAKKESEAALQAANDAADLAKLNAIQEKKAAEERALFAAENAEREKQAAILAEQNKQAAEKQRVADEQAAREANKDHKREVNNAAKAGFMAGGFTEEQAIQAIKLIAKNLIQNVTINY
tara:strand:- start:1173 stop:2003 length:831 start_codon:yes stop_codon:yes gene_type:complete